MENDKAKLVFLINKLEDLKETYRRLKENCENIKNKKKIFKYLKDKKEALIKQDKKYYKKCKKILKTNQEEDDKDYILKEIKKRINKLL